MKLDPRNWHVSESTRRRNPELFSGHIDHHGLRAPKPQRPQGKPLVGAQKGKDKGRSLPPQRFRITYRIWAVRPLDFDNYTIKELQDWLCAIGLLPTDKWDTLEGLVISQKAHTKAEERTEVTIERL